jgi:hypothetical protein
MTEILLIRHAKSFANARDPAFGNEMSPLNEDGEMQAVALNSEFRVSHDIDPELYVATVAVSEYLRTQQTAELARFKNTRILPLINEAIIAPDMLVKGKIVAKHQSERWVPSDLQDRADEFIKQVRSGELPYEIYFTHGFFVAAVKNKIATEYEARGEISPYVFDDARGFIPELATVTRVLV